MKYLYWYVTESAHSMAQPKNTGEAPPTKPYTSHDWRFPPLQSPSAKVERIEGFLTVFLFCNTLYIPISRNLYAGVLDNLPAGQAWVGWSK